MLMKQRDAAFNVFRNTKCEHDRDAYKKLRNLVTQKSRNAKINIIIVFLARTETQNKYGNRCAL